MEVTMNNLIGPDIQLMRDRYDEALKLQGIPTTYQYPNMASSNIHGESVVDSYSEYIETSIFFDSNPKVKTFRRYGWVVENDDNLPFLIHCSFNLPHLQKDAPDPPPGAGEVSGHHQEGAGQGHCAPLPL